MSWHGWFFTADDGGQPHFPAGVVPHKASYVAPVKRLGTTAGHAHLWAGVGRPDARLASSVSGYMHFHDVIRYEGAEYVFTKGAANHVHPVPEQPDYWLICALIRTPDVAACAADPQMFPIGEIVDGVLSDEPWDAADLAIWQARMLAALYLDMPAVVNSPKRMVCWIGRILGLEMTDETGYRCPGE